MTPREYLKIKYAAPTGACKCGNCQLVPPEMLAAWDDEIERLRAVLKRHHRRCMDRVREEYTESQLYDDTKAALSDEQPSGETEGK
jgi:hypothetical protein